MSNERFDRDLRSVLLEADPGEVPEALRVRVAAVTEQSSERRPESRRWRWLNPLSGLASAAALVAVAVVVALVASRLVPTDLGVAGLPSASASAPMSPAASPSSSTSPATAGCPADNLGGHITGWQGAAGSRIATIEVSTTGAAACLLDAAPRLQLIDAIGRTLIDSAQTSPAPSGSRATAGTDFLLAPGRLATTDVEASNYCGQAATLPIAIGLVLSDGGRILLEPAPGVSGVDAVPPCNGPIGSVIAMNGWR